MPDECVNVSVVVAADGSVIEATHDQEVADIRVQPFPSGAFDVAFLTTMEPSDSRSIAEATAKGDAHASVEGLYCSYSAADPRYPHEVTVRVQMSRGLESMDGGFRLDLQLAR
jgi:glutathionyl-hydroquinone reductase